MSAIHWLNDIDGDFGVAADWSGGVVPGASNGAVLDAAGAPFTVTSDVNEKVKRLTLAADATLDITGGTFTSRTGTGAGANAGSIMDRKRPPRTPVHYPHAHGNNRTPRPSGSRFSGGVVWPQNCPFACP